MSLYLLAVTPLTFYAACALLRERSPCVTIVLLRRFLIGGLLALPGYLGAGIVTGWFGSSYAPAALFARLTTTGYVLPAGMAAVAALAVELPAMRAARRGAGTADRMPAAAPGMTHCPCSPPWPDSSRSSRPSSWPPDVFRQVRCSF